MPISYKLSSIVVLLCSLNLYAQHSDLTTTGDGSVLYFTTRMVQTGSDQPSHGKVFRLGPAGLEAVVVRSIEVTDHGGPISNYYDVLGVDISGDGSTLATVAARDCHAFGCTAMSNVNTTVESKSSSQDFDGPSRLSANGRYLVNSTTSVPRRILPLQQWDLVTGESWTVYTSLFPPMAPTGRMVADNGLVVALRDNRDLTVWDHGVPRQLTFGSETILDSTIDAVGQSVVFTSRWPAPYDAYTRLRRVDLATGSLVTIHEELPDYAQPSLTTDGSAMTFVSGGQIYFINSNGSGLRQVTSEPDGIRSAVLSGNGHVAYGLTYGGRLVRVDMETDAATELLGRAVSLDSTTYYTVPGSALVIAGSALDEPDIAVTVGGVTAPIIDTAPGQLTIQVPWEVPLGDATPVHLETAAQYAFSTALDTTVHTVDWQAALFGAPMHEQGDRPVTRDDPATPNETVHVFMTGLGPVSAPVETGVLQPAEPAPVLTPALECSLVNSSPTIVVDVPYAGLEPGALGLYRVSLRMPPASDPSTPQEVWAGCSSGSIPQHYLSVHIPFQD
ncbi:hypothetical protein [uncultured Paludibaculum sp.]|uniref:hypothetical protein n=1 Tax=uncultured Paludibaculum sp. TaxID=1765020 RepID=UPI002AAB72D4|nr:hypothetical protein [uncultured Paludibaculum sp.]